MTTRGQLRLATRGSDLALRQAASVRETLEDRRYEVELREVETRGDRLTDDLIHRLGKTGAFVRALDEDVLAGEADAAVHSMKDMPTEFPPDLVVAGVPQRASAADLLVTPDGADLSELPSGAVVGTSSLRRKAQLLAERPDLTVESLRGNVDTRVEKLLATGLQAEHERRLDAEEGAAESDDAEDDAPVFDQSVEAWFDGLAEIERRALERDVDVEYDAIVLAEAGLRRSGLLHRIEYDRLDPTQFVPSPGQGAIAVTTRDDGDAVDRVREAVDHPRTRVETTVERTVLSELGGGCIAPIGVYATLQGPYVHVTARVLSGDGEREVADKRDIPVEEHVTEAAAFAASLSDRGAAELIDEARGAAEE
ncbi:hydroxymethylbilane synthase [Halobellus ruber]|uniref:Hydroxymethylbilane synthase n=1 Tax=Halobellus ruber TaxID=2761102 RepID=A0A7J9SMK4_9EURY|nr:hydroxymethylbilane synthase [Halobellus ruber]MBB6647306.1 hydroxymethylbilane synthase [Halobellus ruber]